MLCGCGRHRKPQIPPRYISRSSSCISRSGFVLFFEATPQLRRRVAKQCVQLHRLCGKARSMKLCDLTTAGMQMLPIKVHATTRLRRHVARLARPRLRRRLRQKQGRTSRLRRETSASAAAEMYGRFSGKRGSDHGRFPSGAGLLGLRREPSTTTRLVSPLRACIPSATAGRCSRPENKDNTKVLTMPGVGLATLRLAFRVCHQSKSSKGSPLRFDRFATATPALTTFLCDGGFTLPAGGFRYNQGKVGKSCKTLRVQWSHRR